MDLYYGHSLKGKSRSLVELARHLHEQTGKRTRLYSGDGGIGTYTGTNLVEEGILEICEWAWRPIPFTVLPKMAQGHFPEEPGGELVAPGPGFTEGTEIGLVIYEGATLLKKWLLEEVGRKVARGEAMGGGKDGNLVTTDPDDRSSGAFSREDRQHGLTGGLHHMLPYRYLRQAIGLSTKFPGWVVWTAHPTEAPDTTAGGRSGDHGKMLGKRIIGPDICGRAEAATISSLFGNTFHFDTVRKPAHMEKDPTTGKVLEITEEEYRIYTSTHYDADGKEQIEFRAGTRGVDKFPLYFTNEKPGQAILDIYEALQKGG